MNHDVAKVEQDPTTGFHALHGECLDSQFSLELRGDALSDGSNLASVATAADQEKIAVGDFSFKFEDDEVLGFFLLGDLCGFVSKLNGGRNGCLQGRVIGWVRRRASVSEKKLTGCERMVQSQQPT